MRMNIKYNDIYKIILVMLLIILSLFLDSSVYTNIIAAILTLVFSLLLLYKSKKNLLIFLVTFFMFYCNYSIIVGEYFTMGNLGAPMIQVKTVDNYGLLIRIMLVFTSIVALFYKGKKVDLNNFKLVPKDNIVIFYGLFLVLIYILLFGINRSDLTSYTISITPIYEYSILIFIFAYYASGRSLLRKSILVLLFVAFILQDFYYGGRITSLQLMLLCMIVLFIKKLSIKTIIFGGSIGIFINSLVNVYRQNYSIQSISIFDVATELLNNLFVFNTPVYAYYASATHIAAEYFLSIEERLTSFFTWLSFIFMGSNNNIGDVTHYVNKSYYNNHGGGLIFSHFYFWFSWLGVLLIALVIVFFLNRIGAGKTDYLKIIAITMVISVPRWYLYTPLSLLRPILIVSILYVIFTIVHQVLFRVAGEVKTTI